MDYFLIQIYIWIHILGTISSNPKYCGERVLTGNNGSFGIFRNQPIPRGKGIICKWDITVDQGKVIELEFGETKPKDCHFFHWEVFTVNIRQQFKCSFSRPMEQVISSFDNTMRVKFYTDLLRNDTDGFQVHYKAINPEDAQNPYTECGGIVSGLSGTITSPGFPNNYTNRLKCRWNIIPDPENPRKLHNFILKFTVFKMAIGEILEIFNDKSRHATRRFGSTHDFPAIEYTSRRIISIVFLSDHSFTNQGFEMKYTAKKQSVVNIRCNKKLKKHKGTISSPGFPGNYFNGIDCNYTILPRKGFNSIELKFIHFDIEEQQNCIFDKFTLPHVVSGWRGCGNVLPKTVYLSSAQRKPLKLKFHTDDSMTATGFKATYKHINRVCGEILTGSKGSFKSPNYPQPYPKPLNCSWKIVVPDKKLAELTFTEFEVWKPKSYTVPPDCTRSRDYMEIYIGENKKYVGRFCIKEVLPVITSPDNIIWVIFITSEQSKRHKGFHATYRAVAGITCGGEVKATQGNPTIFSTPGAPGFSHANTTCTWTLIAPTGDLAQFDFVDFRFATNYDECDQHGHVLLYYGREETLVDRLCSKEPVSMTSPSNIITVKFISREIDFVDSFIAEFWAVSTKYNDPPTECTEQLTGTSGTISQPSGYPSYEFYLNCSWTITLEPDFVIKLHFEDFAFEFQKDCVFDYVEFVEDVVAVGFPLENKRFCGTGFYDSNSRGPPQVSTTKGNTLTVRMRTDGQFGHRGFILNYKAIPSSHKGTKPPLVIQPDCTEQLNEPSGTISSPVTDVYQDKKYYPNNLDCSWTITVDTNSVIKLHFEYFSLHFRIDCLFDYVEVDNKLIADKFPAEKKRFCGIGFWRDNYRGPPQTSTTTVNTLTIKMRTDDKIDARGFILNYQAIPSNKSQEHI